MNIKKCKGINKAHGYEGCGKPSQYRKFGLCPSCLYDWMQNDERGKIYYAKVFAPKVKKQVERSKKAKDKEWVEKNKTITQLINEARIPFQKYIRLRDANKPCISCGTTTSEIWDAGHYFKAELYTGLIFNENNVHKQCRKCNTYLGGNEIGYRKGLIDRFGEKFVLDLESIANENRSKKFTREELKQTKKYYLNALKQTP
jgi:hypothetical protein